MTLLNYPDKPAPVGNRLTPEAAAAFPTVSRDGKTYTFTVKSGLKFSDGSAVTAASFKRALERAADPNQGSPAIAFMHTVVGADARNEGKAKSVSGVAARGQKLTVRLTKADPTFLAQIAMPFFAAVKANMPINPKGENVYPSAGPYHIVSRDTGRQLVLERNKNYKGSRPANADRIVITVLTDQAQSFLQTKAGQVDYDMGGLPPTAHQELFNKYGVNKSRYFVNPGVNVFYVALNTSRPAFKNVNVRKAVNYAIDRQAMLAQRGYLAGKRADQILPPGIPGFRDYNIYPMKFTNANLNKAKSLMGSRSGKFLLLSGNRGASLTIPQIVKFNLGKIGLDVDVQNLASGPLSAKAGSRNEDFQGILIGWHADYPDPNNFIDILLNGSNIHESNNNNYAYLNVPALNRKMETAASLTGAKRYSAYSALDLDISKNYAPWATYSYANNRDFISSRTGCYSYHPTWGFNLATACMK
jgi:ABC-type oligopeptide transport system substrate-binding subunit